MTEIERLLERVRRGETSVAEGAREWSAKMAREAETAATSSALIDLGRSERCGYPEVVYAPGKTADAIVEICQALLAAGQPVLVTRLSGEQAEVVCGQIPWAVHNAVARTIRIVAGDAVRGGEASSENGGVERSANKEGPFVAVITAGTGDLPVAEEAVETLLWMGCRTDLIVDVGVAGPHRLPSQKSRFADAEAIVVVAGMEGALPSVVGGHVACPVIAVPTSIGYGASFHGLAALLGMLNSCAANVAVVNIDAGFKAGFLAGLIARRAAAR